MKLTILGCGDAFGTGGRFNTCFHVTTETAGAFLIDCGASSLVAIRSRGVDPNTIGTIFLSHLHGDHFGGVVFLILDAGFSSRREAPLTIAGPQGVEGRVRAAMEALFPGSSSRPTRFPLSFVELSPGAPARVNGIAAAAFPADHFSGTPSLSLRLTVDDRTITYSGDTAFTETLVEAARGADLFICEAYFRGRKVSGHMDVDELLPRLDDIAARRVVLTHMGADMLAAPAPAGVTKAHDGLEIEL
jgi:ribonuclease BN (tRNA processing enzyme)